MGKKVWNDPIDKSVDWGGDESTGYAPVSGAMVQKFIKDSFDSKAGLFYYDTANNRYIVFADETTKEEYLEDPTKIDLIIGTFDAPFNYTAEISLATPTYNTIYLGDTGNYLDFTFDVKNKQGASTGESVIVTYTFVRNATKRVHSQVARHGESIHFNIDKYLGEGITTIIIGISGQTTLAATTVAVTYNVVNLQLTDETDISIIYDLSSGPKTMDIPFTVKGSGTKVVEWYLDDVLLEFVKNEDEVVEIKGERVKHIQLENLQQGRHSLQIRAYTTINGEKFYTQTLYRDVMIYTGANSNVIVAMAMEIPAKYGIASGNPIIYGMTQYIPYSLRFATYSPGNRTVQVTVKMDNDVLGSVSSQNGVVNEFSIVSKISGNRTISLTGEDISYDIPTVVSKTTMAIEEIKSGLKIDFSAIGRNNNSESKDSWEQGDYYGTFEGFEWNDRSGWSENRLKINAGASFGINYAPLADNPKALGRTLEFEFKTLNVNDDNAIICDLRSESGAGILITATKVTVTSENGVVVENEFKSNENVRISIVINRATGTARKGLTLIYANGSISRGVNWAVDDNYTSDAQILFRGTSGAEVELKSIRIYESALSDDNILNNFILYRDSVAEMLEVYDRNDVYIEGTTTFSPDKMASRLPVMIVTGDIPTLENTSDKNTQIIVDIEYTNMQDASRSFKMVGAAMRPQGTSSMGYPKKNFRIYSRKVSNTILYDANGKIVDDNLYSFKEGAIPVDCWCLKADYAESSGTHNTGIARMWNNALYNVQINGEYVCRTEAQKAAIAAGYPYDVRTTIDGFPILLFYRRNANDDPIFIGKYNFNNDKSTEKVFGFTDIPGFDNSKMQCWEILNNGNPLALFQTIDGFDSGWKEAYESRYPDTKTPNTDDLKAFSQWMVGVNGDHERFATEKWDHFKIYPMAAYYCYIVRHAAVDQLVKNAMFTSEDGVKFYFIMYDNDTINGLINTGDIDILPTDDRQSVDESGEYKFAGHGSVLWDMLEADTEFMEIVKMMDNALYSAGVSYKECVRIFDEEQADKWVERVYNQDSEYKYVGPYVNQGINNLFMLQGKRDLHRRWWLSKRFSIYDAKFVSGEYKSQSIELKCMNNTPAGQRFSIKAGYPLDYGFGINDVPRETGVTLAVGESHTFETTEVVNLGDPIRIYGAPNIEEVDLSPIANRLTLVTVANVYSEFLGTKLKKLILGGDGVNNIEVSEISGLKQAKMLTHLDVRGMKGIKALDLTFQPYFEELKAVGSGVASLSFAKGSPVSRLELPSTMKAITLEQLPNLTSSGLELEDIRNINTISIKGCPKLSNDFSWIMSWYNTKNTEDSKCTLIMDNVNWTNVDATQLIALKNLGVLNLKGKVVLSSITLEQLNTLIGVFGETAFDKNSDFFINAPDAIFVSGRTELLEGESEDYNCIVFGGEVKRLTWSIYSGGNSYTSINAETGVLTTTEGIGNRTLTIRVIANTDSGSKVKDLTVTVKSRVYPSSSRTTISGSSKLESTRTTYQLVFSESGITGDMVATWTLSGLDGYAEIESHDDSSCVVKKLTETSTLVQGTLSCTLKKRYNNANLFTVTKNIEIVNELVAETDTGIVTALYNAGLCANPNYITKEEAALVTDVDLQPGTSQSTSIFYPQQRKIKSFDGFKYFIGVTSIKDRTFFDCSYLTSITLPEGITSLGETCFFNCRSLTSIALPESVASIGRSCFSGCRSLTSITIPEGITALDRCFYDCRSLTSITLPSTLTSLGESCFQECTSLTSITLPSALTFLGDECFRGCSLTSIEIPEGITSLPMYCFYSCQSLTSITLPEGITSIGGSCFNRCKSLTSITLPSSLTTISVYSFAECGKLFFNVSEGNTKFSSIDGVLFNVDKTTLLRYAKDKIQSSYEVPEGVTSLGNGCFSGCTSLTSIILPSTLTLGESCFSGCTSLTSIVISEGITSLGKYCFSGCTSITSITLPSSLTGIYSGCFRECTSLTSITLPEGITNLGGGCFQKCTSLTSITLPSTLTSLPDYCFNSCTSLTSITLPEGITGISGDCFSGCTSLTSITLPEGITGIYSGCFSGCTSLTSITLPSSLTRIGDSCFKGCSSLASITIPEGVPSLGTSLFKDCSSLASITLPSALTSLGETCFNNCSSLTSIILPSTLTSIGSTCFKNCSSLTSIVIPEGIKTLINSYFDGCTSLSSITLPSKLESIGSYTFRGCSSLTSIVIPEGVTFIGAESFSNCSSLSSITIHSSTAPRLNSNVFGNSSNAYTGRNTYNTGENTLYVPAGATGYDTGQWLDPLQNAEKCGFTLSATL